MTQHIDDIEPWSREALEHLPNATATSALTVETLEGVKPLDDQFGVHPPKTVPDALYELFFGQPEPTEAEIVQYSSAEAVPPMQTYAILDAAKVMHLGPTLENSDLDHRCLFKGDAYDELKDVAPWIVQLKEGSSFTRHLFSKGDAPWYMWDKEPGIYVRSRSSLDDMWRHFRKYIQIQDETDKWFYYRFWEPNNVEAIIKRGHDITSPLVSIWCQDNLHSVIFPSLPNVAVLQPLETPQTTRKPVRLTAEDILALKSVRRDAFTKKIIRALSKDHPDLHKHTNLETVKQLHSDGCARGYKIELASYNFIRSSLYAASIGLIFDDIEKHLDPHKSLSPLSRSKKIWEHLTNYDE